ncbi:hypothetical protein IJO12_00520 [bacterium]|nr:hypothetical protein [bacterium]
MNLLNNIKSKFRFKSLYDMQRVLSNEGIYDYATFESTFAKEFNIPKRSLKKYLEPSYDYQISDFAKGVVKVYIDNKFQ